MPHKKPLCIICGLPTYRLKHAKYCKPCEKKVRKIKSRLYRLAKSGRLKEIGKVMNGIFEEWGAG